jgi:hypothetical protein
MKLFNKLLNSRVRMCVLRMTRPNLCEHTGMINCHIYHVTYKFIKKAIKKQLLYLDFKLIQIVV